MGLLLKASLGSEGKGREVKDGKNGKKNQQECGRWHFFCSQKGNVYTPFRKGVRGRCLGLLRPPSKSPQFNCSDNGGDGSESGP
jgi:hypothetical protein